MSDENRLRPVIAQLIERDSRQRRMERHTAFLLDAALFVLLVLQAPSSPLILWSVGVAAHGFAAFPRMFKRRPQSAVARRHAEMLRARRALERMGVGISAAAEKTKIGDEGRLSDDGELAVSWYPDGQELRWNVRRFIHIDRPAQRERLKRARLVHILLFFVHLLLFAGANALLTPKLDVIALLGWSIGLLGHGFTTFMVEPTPEDDEKRVQLILDSLQGFDILNKPKHNQIVELSSDGELALRQTRSHKGRSQPGR